MCNQKTVLYLHPLSRLGGVYRSEKFIEDLGLKGVKKLKKRFGLYLKKPVSLRPAKGACKGSACGEFIDFFTFKSAEKKL
ncbi:hypothetical protein [Zunongwangia pacifica]|uniref:Uncharacterized protein n=1 Tax=Zunongwangia pacifica TaxID=2911062 RepID=A0A9X2A2B6_9FLAO|nr:hypothetical protein [Zunongwangia pacifica]MCL6220841.1 hypothetical protein [Zunongwangia pacifica]